MAEELIREEEEQAPPVLQADLAPDAAAPEELEEKIEELEEKIQELEEKMELELTDAARAQRPLTNWIGITEGRLLALTEKFILSRAF